jgi:hypothetical protein
VAGREEFFGMNTTITPEERKNWREFAESATVCTLFPEEVWRESKKVLRLLDALEESDARLWRVRAQRDALAGGMSFIGFDGNDNLVSGEQLMRLREKQKEGGENE